MTHKLGCWLPDGHNVIFCLDSDSTTRNNQKFVNQFKVEFKWRLFYFINLKGSRINCQIILVFIMKYIKPIIQARRNIPTIPQFRMQNWPRYLFRYFSGSLRVFIASVNCLNVKNRREIFLYNKIKF